MRKGKRWYPTMLALLLAAGVLSAVCAVWQRHKIEAGDRRVELAMPYAELQSLARLAGKQPVEVMRLFREQGLTSVFYKEPTAEEMVQSGEFTVFTGRELLFFSRGGGEFFAWLDDLFRQGKIRAADTCFVTGKESFARGLAGQLKMKVSDVRVYSWTGEAGENVLLVCTRADFKALANMGLGFPAGFFEESKQAGLGAIVQVRNWPGVTEKSLEGVFEPLREVANLSAVAFFGDSVPGYPKLLSALAANIEKLGVPVLQIEFHPQKGFEELGVLLNKRVLRLHSADPESVRGYSPEGLRSRLLLAAAERNVRVLLVYPVWESGSGDLLRVNLNYIKTLRESLQQKGLQVGPARPRPLLSQPAWLLFFMGLGVISGGLALLLQAGIFRFHLHLFIGLAAVAGWAALLAGAPQTGCKLMALGAAIIFPVLSIQLHLKPCGNSLAKSVLLFFRTAFFSLLGALFVAGLLADSAFMLKLDQFTGVKAAYILPLLLLSVIFVGRSLGLDRFKVGDVFTRAARLGDQPVPVKWVAAAFLLLIVLAVYVIRTGTQEIIPPSALELKIRSFLEHLLTVRPRTKEFFVGHPFLLLLFYTGYRDHRFLPLLILGAIGQISMINTFIHIHTPLVISGLRTFHGLWLGVLAGLVFILIWNLIGKERGK